MHKFARAAVALMLAALALALTFAAAAPAPGAISAATRAPTVLITGSNRGIGLEFARQYAEHGWKVIATARDPAKAVELQALAARHPNLIVESLDVTDNEAIFRLASKYRGQPIDVLLNNAGYLGELDRQSFAKTLDYPMFAEIMRINSYAPLVVSQAFLDNVAASEQKKIVAMTSGIGSITLAVHFGGIAFYRMSKAALNLGMRALQADVRARGVRIVIVAPGEVETQMLRDAGYSGRGRPPAEAAAALIKLIDGLDDQEAKFLLYTGETVPW